MFNPYHILKNAFDKYFSEYYARRAKRNPLVFSRLLRDLKPELVEESNRVPSIFNSGYKHIETAIELAKKLKLNQSHSIADVGAARGETSLMFARSFPGAAVYSFEPIQETFQKLVRATESSKNIKCVNKALASKPGEMTIHIASRITSSSLMKINPDIQDEYLAENIKEVKQETVSVGTLDQELASDTRINILKIDVQGYELEILKGAVNTLERTSIVLLELQNHNIYEGAPMYFILDEFLRKHGFVLYDLQPSIRRQGRLYEMDAIYVNSELTESF